MSAISWVSLGLIRLVSRTALELVQKLVELMKTTGLAELLQFDRLQCNTCLYISENGHTVGLGQYTAA